MLPILSSIIVGQTGSGRDERNHGVTRARGLMLALAYASGMTIVYTALGIAAGLAGEGLAAALQQPWVIALFIALLVTLALSMFGFYELQLPPGWQTYLARVSSNRSGGRLAGVFAMGAINLGTDALVGGTVHRTRLWRGMGLMLFIVGTLLIVGAASGGRDPLRPLEPLLATRAEAPTASLAWFRITSVEQLDGALATATGNPVLLEFYADWCVSCTEMERFTLSDPRVAAKLAGFRLLRVDVTANNDFDKALLKRFDLFGPPATLFFGHGGREVPGTRVIGFERAEPFLQTIRAIDASKPKA